MTRILGAVLAGGRSRRFGSDKALAYLGEQTLLERACAALGAQVEAVVIVGRLPGLPDRPAPDLGPLGGLNAALHHGLAEGYEAVVTIPCDAPHLPDDLVERLAAAGAPAYLSDMPVIGLWRCASADELDRHLTQGDRSMRGWARRIGATGIALDRAIANVNTPADLDRLQGL